MTPLQFMVEGPPQAWQRAGNGANGHHYTQPETAAWQEAVQWAALPAMRGRELLTGPLEVLLVFLLPIPASWPDWKRAMAMTGQLVPTGTPDFDNLAKGFLDALNGIAWVDDAQVVDAFTRKRYSGFPCAVVHVKPLDLLPAQVSRRPKV